MVGFGSSRRIAWWCDLCTARRARGVLTHSAGDGRTHGLHKADLGENSKSRGDLLTLLSAAFLARERRKKSALSRSDKHGESHLLFNC